MHVLWIASAVLSLLSILLMAILIGSRIVAQRRATGRSEAQHIARGALIAFASDANECRLFEALRPLDQEVVSEAAGELLSLIRGDIAPRLRAVLEKLDVPGYERGLLKHGLLPTRLRATEFLAFFPGPDTTASLRSALSDRSHEVQISAAISLASMQTQFDLHGLLLKMQKANVRTKRISELLEIVFRTDRGQVIALLNDDRLSDGLKSLLIDGICRTKSPDLAGLLSELIAAPKSSEFAATLIRSSAVLGHAQSLAMILQYLDSADPELSLAAADAARLLGIPDNQVIAGLGRLLESPQWTLRNAAYTALQSLGPTGREELDAFSRALRPRTTALGGLQLTELDYV